MMHALVVYESMFGNTQVIAEAIAAGLSERIRTEALEVSVAPTRIDDDVALLVVGGPTHAFGLSRPQTRLDAARQATQRLVSRGLGLREWLTSLEGPAGVSQRQPSTPRLRSRACPARRPAPPRSGCGGSASG
jgi:hypothetical protein